MGEQSYISAVIDHVHVVRWRAPSKPDAQTLRDEIQTFPLDEQKWASVHIYPSDLVIPDISTARGLTRALAKIHKRFGIIVCVMDGSGVRVTINRAMVKGMVQLGGLSHLVQVVPALEVAFFKLQPYTRLSRPNFLAEVRKRGLII